MPIDNTSDDAMADMVVKASERGTVAVRLVVRDAIAALAFYEKVFGARHLYRLTMPGGAVAHSEFKIGGTVVTMAEEQPQWGNKSPESLGGSPVALNVLVDDPDATAAKAEAAGATIVSPVSDQFYGHRAGRIRDPFGHIWIVSKVLEELSPEEMQRRMDEWVEQMQRQVTQ